MTGAAWVVVLLLTIWLLVGTIAIVLMAQQVATLTALVARKGLVYSEQDDRDPTTLPENLKGLLPDAAQTRTLVFVSDTCAACHDMLDQLTESEGLDGVVWILLGDRWAENDWRRWPIHFAVKGVPAHELFSWSGLHGVPSAVRLEGDSIEEVYPTITAQRLQSTGSASGHSVEIVPSSSTLVPEGE